MAISLSLWQHPAKPRDVRLYFNGLAGQNPRVHKLWLAADNAVHESSFAGEIPPTMRWEAEHFFQDTYGSSFEAAMRAVTAPPIPPQAPIPPNHRATLESALIVHLVPAARMAGLAFRNGLGKSEIIERLCRNESLAARAVDALQGLQGGKHPEKPIPDWLADDDDTPEEPKAPQLAPSDPIDLSAYVKRPELAEAAKRLSDQAGAIGAHVNHRVDRAEERISSLQKLIEESQPLLISLPEKPAPVQVNGLRHAMFEPALRAAQAGIHVMLVGPAGSGKTYAAEQIAHALSLKYHKQPLVNYAHEILGHFDAHNRYHRTPTREAVEHGGLLNLDEFDASSADAGLACNQVADSSSSVAFPDGMISKHRDFVIIAGTNTDGSGATMEYAGRARLDGATLNRFALIRWDYDPRVEDSLGATCPQWIAAVRAIRVFVKGRGILDVCATMRDIATGVRLIGAGLTRESVLEMTQKRGALVECWAEILRLPAVSDFLRG